MNNYYFMRAIKVNAHIVRNARNARNAHIARNVRLSVWTPNFSTLIDLEEMKQLL